MSGSRAGGSRYGRGRSRSSGRRSSRGGFCSSGCLSLGSGLAGSLLGGLGLCGGAGGLLFGAATGSLFLDLATGLGLGGGPRGGSVLVGLAAGIGLATLCVGEAAARAALS